MLCRQCLFDAWLSAAQANSRAKRARKHSCPDPESNRGPSGLRSDALPAELSRPRTGWIRAGGREGTLLRARVATAAARGLDGRQPEATPAGRASPPNNVAALLRHPAACSSCMILAQGARGPGFNSRSSPFGSEVCAPPCCACLPAKLRQAMRVRVPVSSHLWSLRVPVSAVCAERWRRSVGGGSLPRGMMAAKRRPCRSGLEGKRRLVNAPGQCSGPDQRRRCRPALWPHA